MKAALRGSYVQVAFYMGDNETYPDWMADELANCTFTDESRYTFWVPEDMRKPDYFEKQLIGDYSVFLRKPDTGEIHVTSTDTYGDLYMEFQFDAFTNSALAAFHDDVIEYVECRGGEVVDSGYPDWFYEWITEAINYPGYDNARDAIQGGLVGSECEESMLIDVDGNDFSIVDHCVVLRNKFGEMKIMEWEKFNRLYDTDPVASIINVSYVWGGN